jgi:hypothetical protein
MKNFVLTVFSAVALSTVAMTGAFAEDQIKCHIPAHDGQDAKVITSSVEDCKKHGGMTEKEMAEIDMNHK